MILSPNQKCHEEELCYPNHHPVLTAETIYFVNMVTKKDYLNQERPRKNSKKDDLDSLDRVPSSPERRHCCHPVKKTNLMMIEDDEEDDNDDNSNTRDPCCELFIVQGLLCQLLK